MFDDTTGWVTKAEGDFNSARALLEQVTEGLIDNVCYLCQQCAEKYLKAFLREHDVDFPRTHDLEALLEMCSQIERDFDQLSVDAQTLTDYASDIRYPGVIAIRSEAEEALAAAARIRKFIRNKLGLKD